LGEAALSTFSISGASCHGRRRGAKRELGTIGFEGRFDYAAIGTVSNVASRLCDEAKPGQILISPRVLMKVENAVNVEPVGEFELKGIRRPLAAYNVLAAASQGLTPR
jgi:class 3 adenylate cyclase